MVQCPVCFTNLANPERHFPREMRIGIKTRFEYILCNNCSCLFILSVPVNLNEFYLNYYTENKTHTQISVLKRKLWRIRTLLTLAGFYPLIKVFRRNEILEWIVNVDIKFSDPILDIGCGNGDIIYELYKHGFTNLTGVDPYPPQNISKDFIWDFISGDIFSILKGKFKFIMFNHSLEHITDHFNVLKKASDLLCSSGVIMVRMPIINKAFETYKADWVQIDAPRHLIIHSIMSFKILISKLGLTIYKTIYDSSSFQFIGSEQNVRDIAFFDENSYNANPDGSLFSKKDISKYSSLAQSYNRLKLGDQAVFLLRKQ